MKTLITALLIPLSLFAISDADFFKIQQAERRSEVLNTKGGVTHFDLEQSFIEQQGNGDQARYSDLRGNFNKALAHQMSGYPNTAAYSSLVQALCTGLAADFNSIQIGDGDFLLANPQASLACSLAANDAWINPMPPAPTFASAQTAGEMVELYWTAVVRDVAFNAFDTDADVALAVTDLNTLSDFRGPKVGGMVTTGTFLRGNTPGDLIGPYISQFLYLDLPWAATTIPQEYTVPTAGSANDFLTTFGDWFQVVTGGPAAGAITFDGTPRFIRCPRDLCEYVHQDTPGQAALGALFLLNSYGSDALDPANPYLTNPTQDGFVTFGLGEWLTLLRDAIQEGLKAAWFQKWQVNRRCRPEEYGFYVQQQIVSGDPLGINAQLTGSAGAARIFADNGTYFLPIAYPEGSPTHPSYPAGHAVLMGAAVTVLKALFNEDFEIPSPVAPNAANTALEPAGLTLTLGNELNKLAANISLGRDHAGVHYRSDGFDGMNLGEAVAIDVLNNNSFLFNENFSGFTLTKFDGTTITLGGKRNP